jgi:hypothetical protein
MQELGIQQMPCFSPRKLVKNTSPYPIGEFILLCDLLGCKLFYELFNRQNNIKNELHRNVPLPILAKWPQLGPLLSSQNRRT